MLISSVLSPSLDSLLHSFFPLFCHVHLPGLPAPPHPLSFTLSSLACLFVVPSALHPYFFASILHSFPPSSRPFLGSVIFVYVAVVSLPFFCLPPSFPHSHHSHFLPLILLYIHVFNLELPSLSTPLSNFLRAPLNSFHLCYVFSFDSVLITHMTDIMRKPS